MPSIVSPRPILVTGASGFVGACLCRRYGAAGQKVVAVQGTTGRNWRLVDAGPNVEVVRADLTSPDEVRALLRDVGPEVVVNCAVYGAYPDQTDVARIYRVNFDAVRALLDAAVERTGLRCFIQASSSSEYGFNSAGPREDAPTSPDSDYAVAKVAATAYVQYLGKKKKVPAWVLRLYSVYGPYEDASRLVPTLLAHAKRGTWPKLVDPTISRDFVYADDVCAAFAKVIERAGEIEPGEVFNVGSGQKSTIGEVVAQVKRLLDVAEEPAWGSMPDRRWDRRDWFSNPKKAEEILGWRAGTSLADGLAKTAQWMDKNPALVSVAGAQSVVQPVPATGGQSG